VSFVPSGFANLCAPDGAIITGDGISNPNGLALKSQAEKYRSLICYERKTLYHG
jgi:hypothetical protein